MAVPLCYQFHSNTEFIISTIQCSVRIYFLFFIFYFLFSYELYNVWYTEQIYHMDIAYACAYTPLSDPIIGICV